MRRPSRLTYPEGIRGWIAKVDASPNGGLAIDPNSSSHSTASDRTRSGSKAEIPRPTRFAIHDQRMQCVGRPITGTRIGRGLSEDDPSFTGTYKVPLIGIGVSNGRSELKSGVRLAGIEIYQVLPDSPKAAAGLQGRRAAIQVALVALTVRGLFFPPAAVLGAMLMKQGGIGQSRELIIAVDAQRTRNVGELESALTQAEPGETVYLTVVSGGRREQVRVSLP